MSTAAPFRVPPTAVIPSRDGDPPAPTPFVPSEASPGEDILQCAETLRIPWKRILVAEIDAEQRLRRYLGGVDGEWPLPSALTILPSSFLRSWRVRDVIERLACQARGASVRGALRQLRAVFQHLLGKGDRDQMAFARHLWFAYQRVLLLQRVCRAAAKSRGTTAERLAFICSRTTCSYDDAAWAVCRPEVLPKRGHRLEAAVRKVRDEGFLIPRAESEARSFAELRRIVRASPLLARKRRSRARPPNPVSAPSRIGLPPDAV